MEAQTYARKAEDCFREAMDNLKECPDKVTQMELRTDLVRALRIQESKGFDAQQEIEKAISLDPLDYRERFELGLSYGSLNCLEEAKSAWEEALLLNPDNARVRYNLGVTYLRQSYDLADKKRANDMLALAEKRLNEALELFGTDREQKVFRMRTYYWLGVISSEKGEYDQAIESLNISQALSITDPLQPEAPLIMHCLARAYLKSLRFEEAERQLKILAYRIIGIKGSMDDKCLIKDLIRNYPVHRALKETSGNGLGTSRTWCYVLAKTCHDLAFLYADQAITFESEYDNEKQYTKLDYALELAEYSKTLINLQDNEEQRICKPGWYHCSGWIDYKTGILGRKEDSEKRIKNAICKMEISLTGIAKADNYVHLAQAYRQMVDILNEKKRILAESQSNEGISGERELDAKEIDYSLMRLIIKMEHCHKCIIKLDSKNEYSSELKDLKDYLDANFPKKPQGKQP